MFVQRVSIYKRPAIAYGIWLWWLMAPLLTFGCSEGWIQAPYRTLKEVRTIYSSEWGVPYPAGLSYSLDREHLALLAKTDLGRPTVDQTRVVVITPYEDLVGTTDLAFTADNAINIAYDDARDHLLLVNTQQSELVQVVVDEDKIPVPGTLARFDITHLALKNADGMGVDRNGKQLFILDSVVAEVVRVSLDDELALISRLDLSHLRTSSLRGIAVHPLSGNLFILSPHKELLYELTQSGQPINIYDLAGLNLVDPGGLAFGPSADLTDAAGTMHLFIADSNLPDAKTADVSWRSKSNELDAPFAQSHGDLASASLKTPERTAQVFGRILEIALSPSQSHTSFHRCIRGERFQPLPILKQGMALNGF